MSAAGTIRVLIADDHEVVRAGLRLLLDAEEDIETVAEAGDGERAVFEAIASRPDVVVVDLHMPGGAGLDAISKIVELAAGTRVLVLSMHDDRRYVRAAFEAGATGYIIKEAAPRELVQAVREVAGGGRYLHPELGVRLLAAEADEASRAAANVLSEREREVLRLLALGHTNKEISTILFISVRTAETHRAHIMQKLDFSNRADLIQYALAMKLIDADGP
ncbi:MAG TPA: response regulator transcription factor [Gaiellaceae bacterium]|nr:response regulator transcription factor [Gaiellaceae bacterium]